jgi:hypothetical protein
MKITSNEILWFFLVPLGLFLLSIVSVILWSHFSKTPLKEVYQIIRNPDKVIDEAVSKEFVPPIVNPSMKNNGLNTNPVLAQLDNDAHRTAYSLWCTEIKKWKFDQTTYSCLAPDEEACLSASSTFIDYTKLTLAKPFLIYSNGRCLTSYGNENTCSLLQQQTCIQGKSTCSSECTDPFYPNNEQKQETARNSEECKRCQSTDICVQECKGGPNTPSCIECSKSVGCPPVTLPYVPADVKCDEKGLCTASNKPTCTITPSYCQNKGADYESGGNGNCAIGNAQSIVEGVFGETITRSYKRSVQNLINDCKASGPLSIACVKGSAALLSTADKILYDAGVVAFNDAVQTFKNKCLSNTIETGNECLQCIYSTADLYPSFWLADKATDLLNGILLSLGFPNVKQIVLQAIFDYGGKALDAVFKFGEKAGEAIFHGGRDAIQAIENVGQLTLNTFLGAQIGDALTKYTGEFLSSVEQASLFVAETGVKAAFALVDKVGEDAINVTTLLFKAFQNGAASMCNYIAEAVGGKGSDWEKAIGFVLAGPLGYFFGDAATAFIKSLQEVEGVLKDLADGIEKVVEEAVKDLFCLGIFC